MFCAPPAQVLPSGRETKLERQGWEAVRLLAGFGRAEAEAEVERSRQRFAAEGHH